MAWRVFPKVVAGRLAEALVSASGGAYPASREPPAACCAALRGSLTLRFRMRACWRSAAFSSSSIWRSMSSARSIPKSTVRVGMGRGGCRACRERASVPRLTFPCGYVDPDITGPG
jgi:hypothetical protein